MYKLRIATRKSQMAMVQAAWVQQTLQQQYTDVDCELLPMSTEGDRQLSMPLATIGGKGLFLKELEQALLEGRADIAVHSLKDVTVEQPAGLTLAAYCQRTEVRDALVSAKVKDLFALPAGAVIGTSSLRRQCLVKALRPDLQIKPLRGNVQTRLAKLDRGEYDAIILSAAGLHRLGLGQRIASYLDPEQFVPAVGQGALAIQCRSDDSVVLDRVSVLDEQHARQCVLAERALNKALQGGCQVPIGGYATSDGIEIQLRALVGSVDGRVLLRASGSAVVAQAEVLGEQLAKDLLSQGAGSILEEVYSKR